MSYQFHDVFGLDPDLLCMLPQPCIALLLLFPINKNVSTHHDAALMVVMTLLITIIIGRQ